MKFATVKRYGGEGAEATSAFLGQLLALAAHGEEVWGGGGRREVYIIYILYTYGTILADLFIIRFRGFLI